MYTRFLSRLGSALQFVTASALLACSFLIQYHSIAAYAGLPWLASMIAILLVVGRVLAASYRHSSLTPAFSVALLLSSFRLALLILALSCSIGFFFVNLERVDPEVLRAVTRLYRPPLARTELLLSLSLFLGVLLELALAVVLGHLARAYAPLLRAEQDYRLRRCQYLAQVKNELRFARAAGEDLRDQVTAERERIERRLRQAVADASAGKLAE
ncbi:MAG: hypothetical protein P9F75_02635 [Candidatus Contendobacter sp.]|nr:hypothetical protein [Candidatus Contendobacter sp.]